MGLRSKNSASIMTNWMRSSAQWAGTLWGCAFEDLLTHSFEPDGTNLVEVYLKRRGWNEKAQNKAYMKALRHSVMSLYEVSEIIPGQSMFARDMVRDAEPILVTERSATRSLKQWDRIGARIVTVNGRNILAGGLLAFTHDAAEGLLNGFAAILAEEGAEAIDLIDSDLLLAGSAPLFTNAWLFDTLGKALGHAQPLLHNSDGDEVIFHTVRLPLAKGTAQAQVVERLDGIAALRRAHGKFWNWLDLSGDSKPAKTNGENALLWNVTMDDGAPVLGNVEVKGRFVTLSVSSAARAERGKALLGEALGKLAGPALTEIKTLDQARSAGTGDDGPTLDLPPDQHERIIHDFMDRQYHGALDEPVGMLDGQTPRAACANEAGQHRVANWLKYLENGSSKHETANDPIASYDFGWMWRELGIEHLRR
ncbi:hypothetical protein [Hankyongella ginsenosidimutans]|uniref:hypothetical protein n=1 Tax=Hankyongella ginsenosidimutans TaxID=1763828 RepID=UPI001FEC247A|nr:hypothetical protein [Hankyongella ginsenosidimutans]